MLSFTIGPEGVLVQFSIWFHFFFNGFSEVLYLQRNIQQPSQNRALKIMQAHEEDPVTVLIGPSTF